MDTCLSFLMANMGKADKNSLVFDPFVGTGKVLTECRGKCSLTYHCKELNSRRWAMPQSRSSGVNCRPRVGFRHGWPASCLHIHCRLRCSQSVKLYTTFLPLLFKPPVILYLTTLIFRMKV